MSEPIECDVLVVGGGVVGLSSALFLAGHGAGCTLVERHPDLLIHPRARGLTPRTMEIYRQVGLQQAIQAAAYAGAGFSWAPVLADTLADEVYQRPDEPVEDDGAAASPCQFGPIDQDKLEVIVRDAAERAGARLHFHTELTAFTQDTDGVTATLTDLCTGQERSVRARYLVAADGANSPVREALGVAMTGPGSLFSTITAIVVADLAPAVRGRRVTMAYLNKPQPFTIMMAHDDDGQRWVFGTGFDPSRSSRADFTDETVADMVRAAAGLPDVEVELRPQIPGTDLKVLAFPISAQIADRFRVGRVFLAGDAAHSWPPTGGFGANAGIQDAHNLAWKLAAVLTGSAGDALLDTYHGERHATDVVTLGQAMARFGARMGPGDGPEMIAYSRVAMGYRYRSCAVADEDGDDGGPIDPAHLSGQPGTRAPHCEFVHDGQPMSTLDLYGHRWVLLTGTAGEEWLAAAAAAPVPIDVHRFGVDIVSPNGPAAHGIGESGAVLVRPDGFVAWRAVEFSPSVDLGKVVGSLLGTARVPS